MSLTRAEWKEMWTHIIVIENILKKFAAKDSSVMNRVKLIKDMIQSVIGQME